MAFAARWAELVFVVYPTSRPAKKQYADLKAEVESAGRDPAKVKIAPAVLRRRRRDRESRQQEKRALADGTGRADRSRWPCSARCSTSISAKRAYDEPFTDEELAAISWHSLSRPGGRASRGKKNPSVRDFVELSGRGSLSTNPRVLRHAEAGRRPDGGVVRRGACDGFVLSATNMPGAYEDFVRLVVPELQRRGLFRREYPGTTLRDTLGVPRPALHSWREATERRRA